jgi:hypothetical protein
MKKLVFVLLLPGFSLFQPARPLTAAGIGLVTGIRGEATVRRAPAPQVERLKFKDEVTWQNVLSTGVDSRLRLLVLEKSVITMREQSQLQLLQENVGSVGQKKKSIVSLLGGSARALVEKEALKDSDYEIRTSRAIATIRGSDLIAAVGESLNDVLTTLALARVPGDGVAFITGPGSEAGVNDSSLGATTVGPLSLLIASGSRFVSQPITARMFDALRNAVGPVGPQNEDHGRGGFRPDRARAERDGSLFVVGREPPGSPMDSPQCLVCAVKKSGITSPLPGKGGQVTRPVP